MPTFRPMRAIFSARNRTAGSWWRTPIMIFLSLRSSSASLASSFWEALAFMPGARHFGLRSSTASLPVPSLPWSGSRYTCLIPAWFSLSWRVSLLAIGIAFAELHFVADLAYTSGANTLNLAQLQKAARLFPYDHYYRLGPAQLVIRDNVWYTPQQLRAVIGEAQKYDPYAPMLNAWLGVAGQREHGMDRQGNTRPLEGFEQPQ
jgi:hypothetical protein